MWDKEQRAFIAVAGQKAVCMQPGMANRHGLITGATGTGKTVTLQNMAETFSRMGVPVFTADMKGDLSGVAAAGGNQDKVVQRVKSYGLEEKGFQFQAFPVQFWDVFGEQGSPLRATMTDMGPLLLSRVLGLNETQSSVLTVVFKIGKDEQLDIIDIKDLHTILEYVALNADKYNVKYGNIAKATVGTIQRALAALEHDGAAGLFFGEPCLEIKDLMQTDGGKGVINVLAADKLMRSPRLYSSLLVQLMDRLFTHLPEAGDLDKPKMIFFFDEAHLLFSDAPKALLDKVEQVVRLIRSKGVGIYFITQLPSDIPDVILSQLGNRVQHALRAYTPKDQQAVRAAAKSFRANPAFDTEQAIAELGVGEALLSFLDAKGAPVPVERAFILPPEGQIGPLDAQVRQNMIKSSLIWRYYSKAEDRTSAYEILSKQMEARAGGNLEKKAEAARLKEEEKARKEEEKRQLAQEKIRQQAAKESTRFWGGMAKSVLAPVARQLIGSLFRGKW